MLEDVCRQQVGENNLYLVIDLSGGTNTNQYPVRSTNEPPNLADNACRTTELWLRRIPAGTFIMGSPQNELGHCDDEMQHQVTLTKDFYIGVFPCTKRQYELVMGDNPSSLDEGAVLPVECVSYDMLRGKDKGNKWPCCTDVDEDSFFGRLQARTGLTLDLPTEAQWEYACRAGTTTSLNNGKNLTLKSDRCQNLDEVGWYGDTTHPVGQKLPNAWGLYDMHGNVNEWCLDWYGEYPTAAVTDPQGATLGSYRTYRGGWDYITQGCRSAYRDHYDPWDASYFIGFRVALCS